MQRRSALARDEALPITPIARKRAPTKAVWSWLPQRRPRISAPGAASSATFDAGTERVAWDRPRRSGDDAQAIAARDAPSKPKRRSALAREEALPVTPHRAQARFYGYRQRRQRQHIQQTPHTARQTSMPARGLSKKVVQLRMPAPFKLPRCSRAAQLVTHSRGVPVSTACSAAVNLKTARSSLHRRIDRAAAAAAAAAPGSLSVLRFHQQRQQGQRLLPAQVAGVQRDLFGNPLLYHVQVGAARQRQQPYRGQQRAGQ